MIALLAIGLQFTELMKGQLKKVGDGQRLVASRESMSFCHNIIILLPH